MRYLIISDIHANLEALQAVLEACHYQNIDSILCLGDTIGYGANPKECLAILNKIKAISVAGNHDWAVSGNLNASYFPLDGKEAVAWTRTQFSLEEILFLNSLKLTCTHQDYIIAHASLHHPESFSYLTNTDKALLTFNAMEQPLCFLGHTHIPNVYIKKEGSICNTKIFEFDIIADSQYIINVGSVGQPRDGNPLASYCIYDSLAQTVALKRVQYDIDSAQKKIIKAGLPHSLAERLSLGQ